jgi:hypothetical protein
MAWLELNIGALYMGPRVEKKGELGIIWLRGEKLWQKLSKGRKNGDFRENEAIKKVFSPKK